MSSSFSVWSFARDPEIERNNDYHRACLRGDMAMAIKFLDEGADVDTVRSDMPALLVAVHGGHFALSMELLARGASANCANRFGASPLHFAAEHGHLSLVQDLIEKGAAFVHRKDKNGDSALFYAVRKGHTEIVKFLLGQGVDPQVPNYVGDTPLHEAARIENVEIMEELLKAGGKIDAKNQDEKMAGDLVQTEDVKAKVEALTLKYAVAQHLKAPVEEAVVSISEVGQMAAKEKEEAKEVLEEKPTARRRIMKA